MSYSYQTPAGTPFIPPLSTPEGRTPPTVPPVIPAHSHTPAWGYTPMQPQQPQHPSHHQYPAHPSNQYPSTPYSGQQPFIPAPGSYFPPPTSLPPVAPVIPPGAYSQNYNQFGPVSHDYTGFPSPPGAVPPVIPGGWGMPPAAPPQTPAWTTYAAPTSAPANVPAWGHSYPPFGYGGAPAPHSAGAHPSGWGAAMNTPFHAAHVPMPGQYPQTPMHYPSNPGMGAGWGAAPVAAMSMGMAGMSLGGDAGLRGVPHGGDNWADLKDQFLVGQHYGPVLEPMIAKVVGANVKINPFFKVLEESDPEDRAFLKWDMRFRTSSCQRSTDPQHVSWVDGRNAPATFPRVTELRLLSPAFPWMITVPAANREAGVTCSDVVESISHELYKFFTETEFKSLPHNRHRAVREAYHRNRSRADDVPGGQLGAGMRRLDLLSDQASFAGIEKNDDFVKKLFGDVLPCTFILKNARTYLLPQGEAMVERTARELREAEAARAQNARARRRSQSSRHSRATTIQTDSESD